MSRLRRFALLAAIALPVLAVDQASKAWAHEVLRGRGALRLVPTLLDLDYTRNRGGMGGVLAERGRELRFAFVSVTVASTAAFAWLFATLAPGRTALRVACALVVGGALGNLVDRVRRGYVIDFIDLHVGPWYWPTFNAADIAITAGAVLLALGLLRERRRTTA